MVLKQNNASTRPLATHLKSKHGVVERGKEVEPDVRQTKLPIKYKQNSAAQVKRRDAICLYLASGGKCNLVTIVDSIIY